MRAGGVWGVKHAAARRVCAYVCVRAYVRRRLQRGGGGRSHRCAEARALLLHTKRCPRPPLIAYKATAQSTRIVTWHAGERRVLACDILYDCGRTLNPAVDVGQVGGARVLRFTYAAAASF